MGYAIRGNLILPISIIENGIVEVENGVISGVGKDGENTSDKKIYDFSGKYITPGFVDIHCHGSLDVVGYDNPDKMAADHYRCGTTAMLISLYRNLSFDETLSAIAKIKTAMKSNPNILGVHMEGPYLNPDLGSKRTDSVNINKKEYEAIINTGVVKQWTFSPEIEGSIEFCRSIASKGITPSIGHSRASLSEVRLAIEAGAKIVTHLMDATGSSISPSKYGGTKEVDFDSACMLEDNLFYEIINDKEGIHVRHDMIRLIIKTVGIDKIVGITDCYTGIRDGRDVNFCGAELTGSKLTMDNVARNFLNLGLSLTDVFKAVSYNPSKALGLENYIGQIKKGCRADLLITDSKLNKIEVFKP